MLPLLAKTYALAGALAAPGRTRRIMALKDRHRGQRCFLLGNAPSLLDFDLSKLAGEQFFVVKKGYKALERGLPAPIPYYVLSDLRGWDRIKADVSTLPVGTYLVRDTIAARPEFRPPAERVVTFPGYRGGLRKQGFRHHPWQGLGNDSTVILFAAQIAHYMGFAEAYILGVDLDYAQDTTYFYAAGTERDESVRPPRGRDLWARVRHPAPGVRGGWPDPAQCRPRRRGDGAGPGRLRCGAGEAGAVDVTNRGGRARVMLL